MVPDERAMAEIIGFSQHVRESDTQGIEGDNMEISDQNGQTIQGFKARKYPGVRVQAATEMAGACEQDAVGTAQHVDTEENFYLAGCTRIEGTRSTKLHARQGHGSCPCTLPSPPHGTR